MKILKLFEVCLALNLLNGSANEMNIQFFNVHWLIECSCRSVALGIFFVPDRRATVPPIVKTLYLLKEKTRFVLNFSILLLCQVCQFFFPES